jgi:transcription elongation GreA/GreB family factor
MDLEAVNEEWFAGQLAGETVHAGELLTVLKALCAAERQSEASAMAQRLYDKLADAGDFDQALKVLHWQATTLNGVPDLKKVLKKLFADDRKQQKLIEPAGFGEGLPVDSCFKRLEHLRRLKEGLIVYNSTWGVGTVERVDYFYQQLEIDFEGKGEHELAFNYAAEALEILDEEHLLYIKFKEPARMQEMLKKQPAEVVKKALACYGPMPITRLQETLSPSLIPESGWKRFWDAARKELKEDAMIEIPKKRSDPIILYKEALAFDDSWFAAHIEGENDIETLFERFKEIRDRGMDTTTEVALEALSNRLAFIINGAPSAHPEWKAEGMIYARLFDIEPEGLDVSALIRDLVAGDLVSTLDRLPGRQLQMLLGLLLEMDREAVLERLVEVIPVVSHPVLNELLASMLDNGAEEVVRSMFIDAVGRRKASAPMLLWCQRSPDWINKWGLISKGDLAFRVQEILEVNLAGAMLRAQNQLRDRFSQEEWLHDVMDDMTEQQRRDFLRRTNEGAGWDALDRKSVVAKILRKYPELQDVILSGNRSNAAPRKETVYTSTRSYAEKQRQLEKIMKVDIPENSKEIELARSYGDLRENAEFKYAKERQGLLMAQGAQLAEDLAAVKPSDFDDVSLDEVAMGTGVELVYADGTSDIYYILGAWDQREELAIISSETRLARALIGHVAGEVVEIPSGTCTIKAILPLSDEVRRWVTG